MLLLRSNIDRPTESDVFNTVYEEAVDKGEFGGQ